MKIFNVFFLTLGFGIWAIANADEGTLKADETALNHSTTVQREREIAAAKSDLLKTIEVIREFKIRCIEVYEKQEGVKVSTLKKEGSCSRASYEDLKDKYKDQKDLLADLISDSDCPECKALALMKPEEPGAWDYFVAGFQSLGGSKPTVVEPNNQFEAEGLIRPKAPNAWDYFKAGFQTLGKKAD